MKITEDRFRSILAGTATELSSKEILIRIEAFEAERRGQDPIATVESRLPDVTIVRSDAHSKKAQGASFGRVEANNFVASAKASVCGSTSQSFIASIKLILANLFRREPPQQRLSQNGSKATG